MTLRLRFAVSAALATLAASSVFAAPARKAPAPAPAAAVEEIRSLFDRGDCASLIPKAEALRAKHAPDVEVLIAEANCRLAGARSIQKNFDPLMYEQFRIARGAGLVSPERGISFFRTQVTFEPTARKTALRLLRQARELAPGRSDIVAGEIAALMDGGDVEEAVAVLASQKKALDAESLDDIGRVVQDQLRAGEFDRARRLADALGAEVPESVAARKARAACALERGEIGAALAELSPLTLGSTKDLLLARQVTPLLLFARRWEDAIAVTAPLASEGDDFLLWLSLARMRTSPASAAPLFAELSARAGRSRPPNQALVQLADHYQRVVSDSRRPTVVMRLRAASRFASSGFPLAAVAELDDALDQDPRSLEAWKKLADVLRPAGMFDLAVAALDRGGAIASETSAAEATYTAAEFAADRGRVLFGMGRFKDAAESLARARGQGQPVFYEEGLSLLYSGDKDAALPLLRQAAEGADEAAQAAKAKLEQLTATAP